MATFNVIVIPQGAQVPDELNIKLVPAGNIIDRVAAGRDSTIIMEASTRELQALVEYRDLFDVEITAVVGLHGAMYNTIWNTYVSTMKRMTIDMLLAEQQAENDAKADTGQVVVTNPSLRRAAFPQFKSTPPKVGTPKTVDDDDETGELGA